MFQVNRISDPVVDATYKDIWMAIAKVRKTEKLAKSSVHLYTFY